MANKINEIIEAINGSETVEGLSTRVDNLEDELETTTSKTDENTESIESLDYHVSEVASLADTNALKIHALEGRADYAERNIENLTEETNKIKTYIDDWELVSYDESSNLFTDGELDHDIIIKLETHNSNDYPGFENAEYYNYIPKGTEIINDIPITNFKRVSANNYFITTILISASALEVDNQSVTLNTTFYNISTNESIVVAPTFDKTIDYPSNNKLLIYTRYY